MYILIIISLIFFGLVFWSFGSVIFYRLWDRPTKETWKWFLVWRSECPHCHHQLKVRNLIPIFSYLFQWWKCEYCKSKISWFYPFLEISTVCIFLVIFFVLSKYWISNYHIWIWEWYVFTIFIMICAWLLWLILLYDIKTYELHITAALFFILLSLFFTLLFWINKLDILLWMWIFALMFLFIYCLWILVASIKFKERSEWFWLWDVIIAPILWARLVFFLQPSWMFEWSYLITFFIMLCCIVGLLYIVLEFVVKKLFLRKKRKKTCILWGVWIPFLPSMVIATILEILFWTQLIYIGDLFWNWFTNLFFF